MLEICFCRVSVSVVRSIALWCHLFFISAHVTRGLFRSIFLLPVQECESKALYQTRIRAKHRNYSCESNLGNRVKDVNTNKVLDMFFDYLEISWGPKKGFTESLMSTSCQGAQSGAARSQMSKCHIGAFFIALLYSNQLGEHSTSYFSSLWPLFWSAKPWDCWYEATCNGPPWAEPPWWDSGAGSSGSPAGCWSALWTTGPPGCLKGSQEVEQKDNNCLWFLLT